MAFEFLRAENNAAPIEKEVPATSGTQYKHGAAIKYDASTGKVVLATGTNKPEFVYTGKDVTAAAGDILAAIPVLPEYEFASELSTTGTSLKEGSKVTIASDGLRVTATTTSGVFQLLEPGKASGAVIRGRFA